MLGIFWEVRAELGSNKSRNAVLGGYLQLSGIPGPLAGTWLRWGVCGQTELRHQDGSCPVAGGSDVKPY